MWDILEIIGLALIPGAMVLELVAGRRGYRAPRWWRLRGLVGTVATVAVAIVVATWWATALDGVSLLDLSGLGIAGGAVVGIVVYELAHYWYHRAMHGSNALFRIHQMHHSAESLDAFGANYLHPVDAAMFATWSSLVFVPLLGLRPESAVIGAVFLTFNAMFQHLDIRTPRWLGYIIQRPESHSVHHGRDIHRNNYSDLPLWDMVFGTFENPESFEPEVGFYDGASSRVGAMLVGRDVTSPPRRTDTRVAPTRNIRVPEHRDLAA